MFLEKFLELAFDEVAARYAGTFAEVMLYGLAVCPECYPIRTLVAS